MLAQTQDIVGMAGGYARPDNRVLIQNTRTATVHDARSNDEGHTVCDWKFGGACRRGPGPLYRVVPNFASLPGGMICERCLPTERAIAMNLMGDLSGDE